MGLSVCESICQCQGNLWAFLICGHTRAKGFLTYFVNYNPQVVISWKMQGSQITNELGHEKTCLKIFVVVNSHTPTLLLVWHRLHNIIPERRRVQFSGFDNKSTFSRDTFQICTMRKRHTFVFCFEFLSGLHSFWFDRQCWAWKAVSRFYSTQFLTWKLK